MAANGVEKSQAAKRCENRMACLKREVKTIRIKTQNSE